MTRVVLLSFVALWISACSRHPTDAVMLADFAARRAEYEALKRKFDVAGVWRFGENVAPHFIEGFDADLKKLGVLHASVWTGSTLLFYRSQHAYSIKGIAYWPRRARSISVPDLDSRDIPGSNVYLRDIDNDWCLFLYVKD